MTMRRAGVTISKVGIREQLETIVQLTTSHNNWNGVDVWVHQNTELSVSQRQLLKYIGYAS